MSRDVIHFGVGPDHQQRNAEAVDVLPASAVRVATGLARSAVGRGDVVGTQGFFIRYSYALIYTCTWPTNL